MFGFLNPRPHSREYRRVYARLCQHQHLHYGLRSLAFHSYEAVFLYQCAIDAGAVDVSKLPNQRCCKLMTRGSIRHAQDGDVGRFCASLALLLAAIKLEDDLRDSPDLLARVSRWLLRRRIALAEKYFARLDPRFRHQVNFLLADHQALERRGGPISIDDYAEPTALAFGYVFGLMAKLRGLADHRESLTALGRKVGAAIVAFDCAVDWKRDRRSGEFNPLAGEDEVQQSLLFSAAELASAAGMARNAFGTNSVAARTLDSVRERMLQCNPLVEIGSCEQSPPAGVWTWFKRTVRQSIRLARQTVAVPVLMAMTGDGAVGGSFPPEDGGEEQKKRDQEATSSGSNGYVSSNCSFFNCGGGSGDMCNGCDSCDGYNGCDCNCNG